MSALEDLAAAQTLDALVILPFTSEELTGPVEQVKANGTFIAVVDRGLTDPSIQDLYVAGAGAFDCERTASRLSDMQSDDYLALGHGEQDAGGNFAPP